MALTLNLFAQHLGNAGELLVMVARCTWAPATRLPNIEQQAVCLASAMNWLVSYLMATHRNG